MVGEASVVSDAATDIAFSCPVGDETVCVVWLKAAKAVEER